MAHWHIEYFKSEEFEKQQVQEGFRPSPEAGHGTLM